MPQHRTFEELPVWKDARALCKDIYTAGRRPEMARDRGLVDQITRASVSVISNISEGMERGSTDELIAFLFYAKGSVGEVRAQLYVVEDQGYAPAAECARMRSAAEAIGRQLSGWIKSLQTPNVNQGPRYHREASASQKRWAEMRQQYLANPPWKKNRDSTEEGKGKMEEGGQ